MRAFGKRPAEGNPNMCNSCQKVLLRYHGGAEVEGSLLFADVRGSTALAERITPSEYRVLLDRFYSVASAQVFAHDGIVDKFVGDELVAAFPPYLGEQHAERAVATATALLKATGHGGTEPPWIPVGAGVHTGAMWFGAIGEGSHTEITVIGDTVNVTARLASLAQAGEVLVSAAAADAAGLDPSLAARHARTEGQAGCRRSRHPAGLRGRPRVPRGRSKRLSVELVVDANQVARRHGEG